MWSKWWNVCGEGKKDIILTVDIAWKVVKKTTLPPLSVWGEGMSWNFSSMRANSSGWEFKMVVWRGVAKTYDTIIDAKWEM